MENYLKLLNADPTDWLLEENNPSVRYFTLKDLIGLPADSPEVVKAQKAIMESAMVPEILEKMQTPEYAADRLKFYTAKYSGIVWQLITLAELGAAAVPEITEQCEFMLENARDNKGGFSQHKAAKGGGLPSEVIPCLTGNMVWALIRFGYLSDPRLISSLNWLITYMRYNDGVESDPQVAPYAHYEMCWGRHTCFMGVVKALKAYSAVPETARTPELTEEIGKAAEFMLIHHVFRESHNLNRAAKPGMLKFGFPLMYQTDALEIMDILAALKIKDPRMEEAMAAILMKQDSQGRWHPENSYSDRLLVPFDATGAPDKWLTLRAMKIIKFYYS